jgi:branched-chain amino acid aminotransferase
MSRDAEAFHVRLPEDGEEVHRNLLRLVDANRAYDATLRLVAVRNEGGMWGLPSQAAATDIIALTADTKEWGAGVKLAFTADARHAACTFAGSKILSWAMNLTWLETAQRRGFDEVLLLNERGEVAECTSANIFIANGDQVWTPPLSSGCLPGVTRELLLHEVHASGISVGERPLVLADLESADEVFITSTTRDLLPVTHIEGRPVGRSSQARRRLQEVFGAYVDRYVAAYKTVPAAGS